MRQLRDKLLFLGLTTMGLQMTVIDRLIKHSEKYNFAFSVAEVCGGKAQSLIYVNRYFCELTGYSAADAVGKNCRFLQGAESSPKTIANLRAAFADNQATFQDIINYKKSGERFINRLILLPIRTSSGDYFLGFQNEMSHPAATETLSIEEIHLTPSDLNHYINNALMGLINTLETGQAKIFWDSLEKIRQFILAIDNPQKFPHLAPTDFVATQNS